MNHTIVTSPICAGIRCGPHHYILLRRIARRPRPCGILYARAGCELWGIEGEQGVLVVLKGGSTSDGELHVNSLFDSENVELSFCINSNGKLAAAAPSSVHVRGLVSTAQH
jgi:hypothetical protein